MSPGTRTCCSDAAKLIVEMEYQHVAIDQYAAADHARSAGIRHLRRGSTADISSNTPKPPSASATRSCARRSTLSRHRARTAHSTSPARSPITRWRQAFLTPAEFADVGPGAIALGMTRQVGNETDEFVTPALQQSLLGQPLDLAAINIARGRDLGLPPSTRRASSLQRADRRAINTNGHTPTHAKHHLDALTPYISWNDFASNMIHPDRWRTSSRPTPSTATSRRRRRDHRLDDASTSPRRQPLCDGLTPDQRSDSSWRGHECQTAPLRHRGRRGFNNIDLGSVDWPKACLWRYPRPTFNAIFEDQMERLMDGDRFYYLYRLIWRCPNHQPESGDHYRAVQGHHRAHDRCPHLNGDVMSYADSYVELGHNVTADAASTSTNTAPSLGPDNTCHDLGGALIRRVLDRRAGRHGGNGHRF